MLHDAGLSNSSLALACTRDIPSLTLLACADGSFGKPSLGDSMLRAHERSEVADCSTGCLDKLMALSELRI